MKYKVTLSVNGRFYYFEAAKELIKRNRLKNLITSYPKFIVRKFGINKKYAKCISIVEFIKRLPFFNNKKIYDFREKIQKYIFSKYQLIHIDKSTDIFMGLCSYQKDALNFCKKNNIRSIIDTGSPHPYQIIEFYKKELNNSLYNSFIEKEFWVSKYIADKIHNEFIEADYIMVPSSHVKESILKFGIKEEKILFNPYGTNTRKFNKKPYFKKDKFRIIYGGGICFRKGIHRLINTFSKLNLPQSELVLAGNIDPNFRKYLNSASLKNIKLLNSINYDEFAYQLNQASIFVHPSLCEGLSLVLMQALSVGLPVVCTDKTGGQDFIENGKTGFIVPAGCDLSLEQAILNLYRNDSLLEFMHSEINKINNDVYSWDKYVDRLENHFEYILKNNNSNF